MTAEGEGRPAVFLDRDGVLNRDSDDFIRSPDDLELLPGVSAAVKRLNDAGLQTIVITNQSGVGRGYFTEAALAEIHGKLVPAVEAEGGKIAGIYYCPHLPDAGCDCRKPSPGMLRRAAREHGFDLSRSYLVGDRPEDIACGANAGAQTVLVLSGKSAVYDDSRFEIKPDHISPGLAEAADWIIERHRRS